MHTLFGLVLFNIAWIHGEIIQCLYGELNEVSCDSHLKDSVIYKYYISNYGYMNKNNKKLDKRLDIPYRSFISNQASSSKSDKKLDKPYHIKNCWKNLVLNGNDTVKLKFHSRVVSFWRKKKETLTSENKMIILHSFYNSASIHYFTKNNEIALQVAEEGLEYYQAVKDDLDKDSLIDKKELMLWEILILSVKIDALSEANTSDLKQIKKKAIDYLNIIEWMFNSTIKKNTYYPTTYLLMYRRIILNNSTPLTNSEYPSNIINNIEIVSKRRVIEHSERNMNFVTYHIYSHLILPFNEYATNGYIDFYAFSSLARALEKPVSSTEDRLLNHKAVSIAMLTVSRCIDFNGWISDKKNDICVQLKEEEKYSSASRIGRILPKLIYMERYFHIDVTNLKSIIFTEDAINEENVHMILTMAMDLDLLTYSLKIEIVQNTVAIIKDYYEKDFMAESASGVINMLKWLVELYGFLCNIMNNDGHTYKYQKSLHEYLDLVKAIHENNNMPDDDHLKFLIYKRSCTNLYQLFPWESKYRVTGWILNETFNDVFDNCDEVSTMAKTNNPFINHTDVLILMYRYLMAYKHYDKAYFILIKLSKVPVITFEERARNQEVNELLSYHTLVDNYKTVMEDNYKSKTKISDFTIKM